MNFLDFFRSFFKSELEPEPASEAVIEKHVEIIDIRKIANPMKVDKKGKRYDFRVRRRKKEEITGICLHQTACVYGNVSPSRYATVGAHYLITMNGETIWIFDDEWFIWAANQWSGGTISIEFEGVLAGKLLANGKPDSSTVWDDPSTPKREFATRLTDAQKEAGKKLIRELSKKWPIRVIVSHRQSSKTRRADPGPEIWQEVAIPMIEELQFKNANTIVLGDGRPVPVDWDPNGTGEY